MTVFSTTGSQRRWFLQRFWLFSEADLYFSVVRLAVLGSPVFPHLHRAIGGQILHPEAHLLGKLHCCRNAMVRIQVWHTILELKENGGQMHKGERERERTGKAQSSKTEDRKLKQVLHLRNL